MSYVKQEEMNSNKRRRPSEEEQQPVANESDGVPQKFSKTDETYKQEIYFYLLFSRVLDFMIKELEIDDNDIYIASREIKKSFPLMEYMEIDFNLSKNACAYFYCYSSLNAAVARNRFLDAFNNCQEIKFCMKSPNINVISLGGGPGTDMVGFCSVMQEFISEDRKKQLDLTVVDLYERWGSFYNIIEFFIREKKFGNTFRENHSVNSSFMTVDLRDKNPPLNYITNLKNADIILLARVLDVLNHHPDVILENIVFRMKEGALLLLIDGGARFHDICGLERIYVSNLEEFEVTIKPPKIKFNTYPSSSSKAQIAVFRKYKSEA